MRACPICGGKPIVIREPVTTGSPTMCWRVLCDRNHPQFSVNSTLSEAIALDYWDEDAAFCKQHGVAHQKVSANT